MPPSPSMPPSMTPTGHTGGVGVGTMLDGQTNFWQGLTTPGGTGVGSMWGGNTNFYGGMGSLAPGSTGINTMTGGVTNFHRRVEEEVGSLEAPDFDNPVSCEDDEEC